MGGLCDWRLLLGCLCQDQQGGFVGVDDQHLARGVIYPAVLNFDVRVVGKFGGCDRYNLHGGSYLWVDGSTPKMGFELMIRKYSPALPVVNI